jgi:ATP-dependent DNA ligase
VIIEVDGLPSFSALQEALTGSARRDYVFYAFDPLYLGGRDLQGLAGRPQGGAGARQSHLKLYQS